MNQTDLLDFLEHDLRRLAEGIHQQRTQGDPTGVLAQYEERLAKMLKNILVLRQELGIPANPPIVEDDTKER